jgi:hypothetical protein
VSASLRRANLTTRGGPAFAGVPYPIGITIKKSALMALFLIVMRSGVIIASQIDLSEAIITEQVTDAQLLSVLSKYAKLLS